MRFATGCSGIGVPDLAAEAVGWEPVFACENAAFPRAVLAERFGYGAGNGPPLLDDFLAIDPRDWPGVECFIAGTPCQSYSIAGLRGGLRDPRGGLTFKFVELCHGLQDNGRSFRWAVWENVPGVLTHKENPFGNFISALVGGNEALRPPGNDGNAWRSKQPTSWPSAGMVSGPRARLAWRVLDSQFFGVPQRRQRVFVVVSFGEGDPAKVLFEPGSGGRDYPAGGETGKDVAGTLSARPGGCGGLGTDFEIDGGLVPEIAWCLQERDHKGADSDTKEGHLIPVLAHSLRGEGFDASEDGTGRGTPLVPVIAFSGNDYGQHAREEVAPTLRAGGHTNSHQNGGIPPRVLQFSGVRKLTPRECERLQGLPDDFTLLRSWPRKRAGWRDTAAEECEYIRRAHSGMTEAEAMELAGHPDGPRYKALGNAWTYNVAHWLLSRLDAEDRRTHGGIDA